jgi:hypothetical protein
MIGNSWWSDSVRNGEDPKLAPPRCVISISGEPAPQEAAIEWTSASGKTFDVGDPPTGTTFLGRCVGKQLFISDVDEKKKKVEALVKIMAPVSDEEPERIIGTFPSKPIKVISKPSKKRQSAKNLERKSNIDYFTFYQTLTLAASVHKPRFHNIALSQASFPNRLNKIPMCVGFWCFVQRIGRPASPWRRPALKDRDTLLHRSNC